MSALDKPGSQLVAAPHTRPLLLLLLPREFSFNHLVLYEISYMWNAAIACMFCFVVGAAVSLIYKPQDPKKMNPELISPGLYSMFKFWPTFKFLPARFQKFRKYLDVNQFLENLEVGKEFVSYTRTAVVVVFSFPHQNWDPPYSHPSGPNAQGARAA